MRAKNLDKHQKILEAAIKIFAHNGFYQSKVSEIAKEAGVADGTIYLYFKNKDDLLISIFEVKMRELIASCREAMSQCHDAPSRLLSLVKIHLSELEAYPELAAVFQVELRQSSRFMREYNKAELREYLDLIGEVVEQGQREGIFRENLPRGLVKRFIFGALDESVSTWVLAGKHYSLASQAEPLLTLFLQGIGKPGGASGGNAEREGG